MSEIVKNYISKMKVPGVDGAVEYWIKDAEARETAANALETAEEAIKIATDALGVGVTMHEPVDSLESITDPQTNTIYLVTGDGLEPNVYEEYVYIAGKDGEDGKWEKIGDTKVDLDDYIKAEDVADQVISDLEVTGAVSKPAVTVTPTKSKVYTAAGEAGTAASFTAAIDEEDAEMLVFTFVTNTPTVLPTLSESEYVTDATAALKSAPTFTGTISKKED